MPEEDQVSSTEEGLPPVEGYSIDPATWVEPKQSYPGEVLVSEYRWCSDKYLDVVVQRTVNQAHVTGEAVLAALVAVNPTGVPRIPQWNLVIKRLDAINQEADGSQHEATRYGGYDLVSWSTKDKVFYPVNPNVGKAAFISSAWTRLVGRTEPPSILVGRLFQFDFYPSKRFGSGMPARWISVPTAILPPDYRFTGEVQVIIRQDRVEATGEAEAEAPVAAPGLLTEEAAIQRLITEILPGKNNGQAVSLLAALPPEMRVPSMLQGLATGELTKKLAAEGKIIIRADGVISLPA